jgi:2-haloacid dehalogenase
MARSIDAVVFDIGNVLLIWDPRHLFRKLLPNEDELERFLCEICTAEWNVEQDRGRTWNDAITERVARFPEHEGLIRAYHERWHEMLPGPIEGTVQLLERLAAEGVPLYAITNFSSEKFEETRKRFGFLDRFRDIIVSGEVRLLKPDPKIYRLLIDRHGLKPDRTLFVDDSPANIAAAEAIGLKGTLFRNAQILEEQLKGFGLLQLREAAEPVPHYQEPSGPLACAFGRTR